MSKYDRPITHNGVTRSVKEWAGSLGLAPGSLYNRILKDGVEKALARRRLSLSEAGRLGARNSGWRREATAAALSAQAAKGLSGFCPREISVSR